MSQVMKIHGYRMALIGLNCGPMARTMSFSVRYMAAAEKLGAKIRQEIWISKPMLDHGLAYSMILPMYPIISARAPMTMSVVNVHVLERHPCQR